MSVQLAPSILSADFTQLGTQLTSLRQVGMDWVHLDVMDGHFVPNLTIGPMVCRAVHQAVPGCTLDVHLMVQHPGDFVEPFVQAGAKLLTVHVEAEPHLDRVLSRIRELGARPGISLNPATSLSVLDDVLPLVDLVLVMSVNPGFGGQSFIPYCQEKISRLRAIRKARDLAFRISVDGGVNQENIQRIRDAGADVLVAGSAVFRGDPVSNFEALNRILTQSR